MLCYCYNTDESKITVVANALNLKILKQFTWVTKTTLLSSSANERSRLCMSKYGVSRSMLQDTLFFQTVWLSIFDISFSVLVTPISTHPLSV